MVAEYPQPPAPEDAGEPAHAVEAFTMVRQCVLDIAAPHLEDAAFRLLIVLLRHTIGFQRESAIIPISQLMRECRKSKQGLLNARAELERFNLISCDVVGDGRGRESTYRVLPRDQWRLPQASIGQVSRPIEDAELIGQLSSPISDAIGQVSRPIDASIGQVSRPLINKERKKEKRKKILSADAPVDASKADPKPTPKDSAQAAPKPAKVRKMTDEEYAYCQRILELVKPLRLKASVIKSEVEWAACRRIYTLEPRPTPEQIAALYALELQRPRWESFPLNVANLPQLVAPYLKSPGGYAKAIERSRKGADGGYNAPPPNVRGAGGAEYSKIARLG